MSETLTENPAPTDDSNKENENKATTDTLQTSAEDQNQAMPALEQADLDGAAGNAPRETSSGSASPVPDEPERPKRKVNLGRDISLMMQALNSLHSPEEKLAALCKKYADLLEQQKAKDKRIRGIERKLLVSGKEKEHVQKELNTAILGKSRMESLARELNKQNKLLKEESLHLTVSHNKERELVSAKFQTATEEISGKINAIADRNEVLNEKNKEMSDKIEKLLEESVTREKMVRKVLEQRDLQEKILELKAKEAAEERDTALNVVKELRSQMERSKELYENHEKELKAQITFYSKKVNMFQSTLDKSNQVFSTFRTEMDGMGKSVKTLEKATEYWKKCCQEANNENKKLSDQVAAKADTVAQLNSKVQKLSELCRALQIERHELAKSTKPDDIEPTVQEGSGDLSETTQLDSSREHPAASGSTVSEHDKGATGTSELEENDEDCPESFEDCASNDEKIDESQPSSVECQSDSVETWSYS